MAKRIKIEATVLVFMEEESKYPNAILKDSSEIFKSYSPLMTFWWISYWFCLTFNLILKVTLYCLFFFFFKWHFAMYLLQWKGILVWPLFTPEYSRVAQEGQWTSHKCSDCHRNTRRVIVLTVLLFSALPCLAYLFSHLMPPDWVFFISPVGRIPLLTSV